MSKQPPNDFEFIFGGRQSPQLPRRGIPQRKRDAPPEEKNGDPRPDGRNRVPPQPGSARESSVAYNPPRAARRPTRSPARRLLFVSAMETNFNCASSTWQ